MIVGLSGRIHSGKDSVGTVLIEQLGFKRVAFADGVREFVAATFGWPMEWVNSANFKEHVVLQDVMNPIGFAAKNYTGRELLQRVGTEAARKVFGDDCWIKVALAKCGDYRDHLTPPHEFQPIDLKLPPPPGVLPGECAFEVNPTGRWSSASWICSRRQERHPWHVPNYVITDVRFPNEHAAIKAAGGKVIRLNRAALRDWHNFVDGPLHAPDACAYLHYSLPDRVCGLPASCHPTYDSGDTHPSETSLPCDSNETIKYDGVATGSLAENILTSLALVKGWLAL